MADLLATCATNSRIAGDYGFAEYDNNPYAFANGYEFVIARTRGRWLRGSLSYAHTQARGLSNYEDQGAN